MQASAPGPTGRWVLESILDIAAALKRRSGERSDPATVFLLRHLHDTEPQRISDLAESSRLDISTVSRHVKALTEAGLLDRIEDPDDKRAWRLRITREGARVYDAAMADRSAVLDQALASWPTADRDRLARLMDRLSADLGTTPVAGPDAEPAPTPATLPTPRSPR